MRLKIRYDRESWKVFAFWVEVNKALEEIQKEVQCPLRLIRWEYHFSFFSFSHD